MTAIESPCIQICQIDEAHDICTGCGRTRREIALWTRIEPEERRAVMDALPDRLHAWREARKKALGRTNRRDRARSTPLLAESLHDTDD